MTKTPQEKLPRVWISWQEKPRKHAAKLYASASPPGPQHNPLWKPDEYLSLAEHEELIRQAKAEAFEAVLASAKRIYELDSDPSGYFYTKNAVAEARALPDTAEGGE